jgi:hypothetical protein
MVQDKGTSRVLVFGMSHLMMMNRAHSYQIRRVLTRSLLLGALSSIAVLTGWAPNISGHAKLLDSAAYAQDEAFTRYVKTAFELEKARKPLFNQVKQLIGGPVPNDICRPGTIAQLNTNVRDQVKQICGDFAEEARKILARNQISRDDFNRYQKQSRDPAMKMQIENTIRTLGLR